MIFITDMDETLTHQGEIPIGNIDALIKAKQSNITNIIATGRNFYSAQKLIQKEFPIDYLIFSMGIGIVDWKNQEFLLKNRLEAQIVPQIVDLLLKLKIDFCLQKELPDNHHFYFYKQKESNPDFDKRLHHYHNFSKPLNLKEIKSLSVSQVIAILSKKQIHQFDTIKKHLPPKVSIVRTTSPLDHQSMWIEILPKNINKGKSLTWLINQKNLTGREIWGIGNDYNDLDFLDLCHHSYVVDNAPNELKEKYKKTSSSGNEGVSKLIKLMINHKKGEN